MASDKVYGGRVSTVAGILILSLMLQSSSREFSSTDAFTVIPENISKHLIINEDIDQQQPALINNNQADQNDSNLIPEVLSKDYQKLKFLTGAFTVIPENVSKPITTNEEFSQQQLALFSNNQADQNDSNPIPEILSEDNEKLKFLTERMIILYSYRIN